MNEISIADEKAQALSVEAEQIKTRALSFMVRSPHEYEITSAELKNIKTKYNEVEARRVYLKEPVLEQARRIDAFFKPPLQFLKDAETAAKQRLLGYEADQRRIAAEEQRRLEEKARKEREALEAKARKEREEADAKASEIERQAAEARAAGDLAESVKLLNQASKIVEKSEAKAEAIQSKAEQVIAPKVEAYIPPVVGQFSKTVWKARVVDANSLPREYTLPNQVMLDKMAAATKGQVPIPGVEFYSEQVMAARAK